MGRAHNILTALLCWGLRGYILVLTLHAGWSIAKSNMVDKGMFETITNFQLMQTLNFGFAAVQLVSWLLLSIGFLFWLWQACRISQNFGLKDLEFTPSKAVLSYFIPVISCFRPLLVMEELWKSSSPDWDDREKWRAATTSSLPTLWWVSFILMCIVGMFADLMQKDLTGRSPGYQCLAYQVDAAGDILGACASVLLLSLVSQITKRQKVKTAKLAVDQTPL